MSGATRSSGRPVLEVLLNALGLGIWALHFGAIYAVHAVSCERGFAGRILLGLPLVPVAVIVLTVLALAGLALVMRPPLRRLDGPLDEGGETEPRFTRWFAATTAALAALAVVFQAVPALVVPACS